MPSCITFYKTRLAIVLLLALSLCFTSGCGRTINRVAEEKIRDVLPSVIGPAKSYKVQIVNSDLRTLQGKVSTVFIEGTDVILPSGLLLDKLNVQLKDVVVDTGRKKIKSIRSTSFDLSVSEANLDEFMAGESPVGEEIQNIRIHFKPKNVVTVTGARVTIGLAIPFTMTGPVKVAGAQKIELDPEHLVVSGLPIGGVPLQFIKKRIESSADLSNLGVPMTLSKIETQASLMRLYGTIDAKTLIDRANNYK